MNWINPRYFWRPEQNFSGHRARVL